MKSITWFIETGAIMHGSITLLNSLKTGWRIYASVNWCIIGSDNGLSPVRRQAITWTSDESLSIGLLGTHFSQILIEIQTFSLKKMHLKISSVKWGYFVSTSMCRLNQMRNSRFCEVYMYHQKNKSCFSWWMNLTPAHIELIHPSIKTPHVSGLFLDQKPFWHVTGSHSAQCQLS